MVHCSAGTLRAASPCVRGVHNSGRRRGRNQHYEGDEARLIPFDLAPFPGWRHAVGVYSQAGRYIRGHGCPRSAGADHGGSSTMNPALAGANPRERVPRAPAWPRGCPGEFRPYHRGAERPHGAGVGRGHSRAALARWWSLAPWRSRGSTR